MTRRFRLGLLMSWLALASVATRASTADDPPPNQAKAAEKAGPAATDGPPVGSIAYPPKVEIPGPIAPLPPVAIPDDPPPHEGNFFDLPVTVEPPDILVVEVLEGLPGRPITGERLIRPDGTISLGFYGDVHVRGLTIEQAKAKVIIQLQKSLNDATLGLIEFRPEITAIEVPNFVVPEGGRSPFDVEPMEKKPKTEPLPDAPADAKPSERHAPRRPQGARPPRRTPRPISTFTRQDASAADQGRAKAEEKTVESNRKQHEVQVEEVMVPLAGRWITKSPAESDRVFVDISSYNSKSYYVQGDVGVPGRLPTTGKETVLDALNYAGGLLPSAEPSDIHLYRPARAGKPARDYRIDFEAIRKGDAKANLQVFPDDRLVVGRNPIVKKTTEVDRAAGPINSLMNAVLQYSISARSLLALNNPPAGGSDPARVKVVGPNTPANVTDAVVMGVPQRDTLLKDWMRFLWSISAPDGGSMLDEEAFRDALLKRIAPAADPK